MYLIKSLHPHNRTKALLMGSVRIGTINYYREIEDDARADNEEGLGRIVWVGQRLEAEHHNKIFSPIENVELADGWSIENKGCPLLGSYPSFNAYLYCYSEVQNLEEISATAGGKGDSYLCIAKPMEFVASVTEQLRPIIEQDIMEHAPSEQIEQILKTLRILDVTYRVNYDDRRKDRLVDEANVESFDPMAFHPQDFFKKLLPIATNKKLVVFGYLSLLTRRQEPIYRSLSTVIENL